MTPHLGTSKPTNQSTRVLVLPSSSECLDEVIVYSVVVREQHWADKKMNYFILQFIDPILFTKQ
jgi:hypothetical protein